MQNSANPAAALFKPEANPEPQDHQPDSAEQKFPRCAHCQLPGSPDHSLLKCAKSAAFRCPLCHVSGSLTGVDASPQAQGQNFAVSHLASLIKHLRTTCPHAPACSRCNTTSHRLSDHLADDVALHHLAALLLKARSLADFLPLGLASPSARLKTLAKSNFVDCILLDLLVLSVGDDLLALSHHRAHINAKLLPITADLDAASSVVVRALPQLQEAGSQTLQDQIAAKALQRADHLAINALHKFATEVILNPRFHEGAQFLSCEVERDLAALPAFGGPRPGGSGPTAAEARLYRDPASLSAAFPKPAVGFVLFRLLERLASFSFSFALAAPSPLQGDNAAPLPKPKPDADIDWPALPSKLFAPETVVAFQTALTKRGYSPANLLEVFVRDHLPRQHRSHNHNDDTDIDDDREPDFDPSIPTPPAYSADTLAALVDIAAAQAQQALANSSSGSSSSSSSAHAQQSNSNASASHHFAMPEHVRADVLLRQQQRFAHCFASDGAVPRASASASASASALAALPVRRSLLPQLVNEAIDDLGDDDYRRNFDDVKEPPQGRSPSPAYSPTSPHYGSDHEHDDADEPSYSPTYYSPTSPHHGSDHEHGPDAGFSPPRSSASLAPAQAQRLAANLRLGPAQSDEDANGWGDANFPSVGADQSSLDD